MPISPKVRNLDPLTSNSGATTTSSTKPHYQTALTKSPINSRRAKQAVDKNNDHLHKIDEYLVETSEKNDTCHIVYSGAMFFWADEIYADIDIIEHIPSMWLEVAAFDVERNNEAKHVFISTRIVHTLLRPNTTIGDKTAIETMEIIPAQNVQTEFGLSVAKIKLEPLDKKKQIVDFILGKLLVGYTTDVLAISLPHEFEFKNERPEGLHTYKIQRNQSPSKHEFDAYVSMLQEDLLKVSISASKASQLQSRSMQGIIVKRLRDNLKEATARRRNSRDAKDPRNRWGQVLNVLRKRGRVSIHREVLGLPKLSSLNEGDVVDMHDTLAKQVVEEMAANEVIRTRRLDNIRKFKDQVDGAAFSDYKETIEALLVTGKQGEDERSPRIGEAGSGGEQNGGRTKDWIEYNRTHVVKAAPAAISQQLQSDT